MSKQKSMIKVLILIILPWKRRKWHDGSGFLVNLKAYANLEGRLVLGCSLPKENLNPSLV